MSRLPVVSGREAVRAFARISELVESIGGRIHYDDIDMSVHTGTIYVHGEQDFDIVLPEFQAPPTPRDMICTTILSGLPGPFTHPPA